MGEGTGRGATDSAGTGAGDGIVAVAVAGDVGVDVGVGVGGDTGLGSVSILSWFSCRVYVIIKYKVLASQLHGCWFNHVCISQEPVCIKHHLSYRELLEWGRVWRSALKGRKSMM